MLHGFGDPRDCGESRLLFWSLGGDLLRAIKPDSPSPGLLGVDPVRAAAIRSVVTKLLDAEDHTVDSPAEREVVDIVIESASGYAQAALAQLAEFRKILSRAEGMKLAAGAPAGPNPS
jgi:hypothetical protein